MCTKTITVDLLQRWRAGEIQAVAELLFNTGLWDELLKNVPEDQRDAAEDAILQVFNELSRREQDFAPADFLEIFRKQYGRRKRDFLYAEALVQKGAISVDASPNQEIFAEDSDWPNDAFTAGPDANPEYEVLQERVMELVMVLLQDFKASLTKACQDHFMAVERGFAQLYPWASPQELASLLFEFLQVDGKHREDLAQLVLDHCCGNQNTNYTHNRRMRKAWQRFISSNDSGYSAFIHLRLIIARLMK